MRLGGGDDDDYVDDDNVDDDNVGDDDNDATAEVQQHSNSGVNRLRDYLPKDLRAPKLSQV